MIEIPFPTSEEIDAMAAAGRARRLAAMERGGDPDLFCPLDLGDWMDLAQRAGVPAVPALKIAEAGTNALWESVDTPHDGEPGEGVREFFEAVHAFQRQCGPGWMLRWSCCSMAEVKFRLSEGDPSWDFDLMDLYVNDFRAFDLIGDYPRPRIAAWARPWLTFDVRDSYPVEYRVFVAGGAVQGVSNYYPQRALPEDEQTRADIDRAVEMARRMIAAQAKPMHLPQAERDIDPSQNWWTADFARLPSGAIIFLEGGPPHLSRWGAHPCCFKPGETNGVALRSWQDERAE